MEYQGIDWRIRVFDSLSFPTLILKPDMTIVDANRVFFRKYGTIDQIVGKTCHEIFFNSKRPCQTEKCPFSKVLADRKGHSKLNRIINKQGEESWEERVFSPILDDDGGVAYIMESIRDITQIKNLERRLTGIQEFLVSVVQSSASAILAADRDGNILVMNEAAEELFGYRLSDSSESLNIVNLYPPGMAKETMKKLRSADFGGKGKLLSTKATILNAKGEEIPVEMTAAIIYSGDQEIATTGIYNDLRERLAVEKKLKETQAQLVQSEKMASMGQLAAGVAHELNNPLTGILFYASLAKESLDNGHPLIENLDFIIEDVQRCKGIVQNLLAYGRQSNPNEDIIQLGALVDRSLTLIPDKKVFGNIVFKKEIPNEMMLVHVDKNQICQVIINLIMNACDAMNGEGTITFRAYRDKPQKKVFLEVCDSGCGIPEENLDKVFDPFFTTKGQGKGTGLGLSTAYGIIKENGGHISVKETGPEGTTFLVELPLYVPDADSGIE